MHNSGRATISCPLGRNYLGVGVGRGVVVARGVGDATGVGVTLGVEVGIGVGVAPITGVILAGVVLAGVGRGTGTGLGVGVGLGVMPFSELYRSKRPPVTHFPVRTVSLSTPLSNLEITLV